MDNHKSGKSQEKGERNKMSIKICRECGVEEIYEQEYSLCKVCYNELKSSWMLMDEYLTNHNQ